MQEPERFESRKAGNAPDMRVVKEMQLELEGFK